MMHVITYPFPNLSLFVIVKGVSEFMAGRYKYRYGYRWTDSHWYEKTPDVVWWNLKMETTNEYNVKVDDKLLKN